MSVLQQVNKYEDLNNIADEQLPLLCQELREQIITITETNGGHLASSLGAVELTVALLKIFNPYEHKIVFDVGHQTYSWKLLTGRREQFCTLRQEGGLSGFPKREESPCDHFNTGHSSTALSAAMGYAITAKEGQRSIAVVGDGAIINGQSFEALNHIGGLEVPVICVLNDNGISISPRVGGMAKHLASLSTSSLYRETKQKVKSLVGALPQGEKLTEGLRLFKNKLKRAVTRPNMFSDLGWTYWGPFDGHNLEELIQIFALAKKYDKPLLIHLITQKGKGHRAAEEQPVKFHGVSPKRNGKTGQSWSCAVTDELTKWATHDNSVMALTPAMCEGSCLGAFASQFPTRFFDGGIAEEHMMTFAGTLSAGGATPVLCIYSTFMQRAMDQLVHDVALQNLDLTVAIDRAGCVGEDGETHHGFYDLAWSLPIPGVTLWSPADKKSLQRLQKKRAATKGPLLFRFPRGVISEDILGDIRSEEDFHFHKEGSERWGIIALGTEYELVRQVLEVLREKGATLPAYSCLEYAKPLPLDQIERFVSGLEKLITVESGLITGGVGEQITLGLARRGIMLPIVNLGVPQKAILHSSQQAQKLDCGISVAEILSHAVD